MCVRYRRTTAEEELARIYKIPVRDYLGSVVPGSPNFPINRIAELTPAAWLARN
jgi:hypothetical protein